MTDEINELPVFADRGDRDGAFLAPIADHSFNSFGAEPKSGGEGRQRFCGRADKFAAKRRRQERSVQESFARFAILAEALDNPP